LQRADLETPPGLAAGLTIAGTEREALFAQTAQQIQAFLDGIAEGPVTPPADPDEIRRALAPFDFHAPRPADEVLGACTDWLRRWTTHVTHPRYFGLFNPKPATAAIAADSLVAAVNPQLATWTHSPAAVEIERHVIRFLGARLGLPADGVSGSFTSGGAEANHTGVLLSLTRTFPRFVTEGARALPGQPLIYASAEAHDAIVRIAQACGLGRNALRRVDVDADLKLDVAALADLVQQDRRAGGAPFLVVATGGTTSGGVIDPLPEIVGFCRAEGLRLHVDAAWAGGLALSDRSRSLLSGIEQADSITLDAHKWLSAPMGAGVFLCTDEAGLEETFALATPYMPPVGAGADPFRISMQWSRRCIGLKVFATLAVGGQPGFQEVIERQIALADHLRAVARESGWEIANRTPLPLVCLAHPDVDDYDRLAADVVVRGRVWLSATRLAGRAVIRTCITNIDSTAADIEAIMEELDAVREGSTQG
jgi:aromatic-L-amino-acid/L-tryptophan decarboxylase